MKGNAYVPFMLRRGDGSTLSLDFTAMSSLDSRFTFTRSTTATFINSSGYVTSAAINAPRFDYDPTTLTPRGLLMEGSATNLCTYSEDFSNVAWTKSNTNGSMSLTGTAPDSNATSRLLEENTTSYAKHSLERSITISAGIHTFSVWLKQPSANSRRYAHIQLADGQTSAARYTVVVDVQAGEIVASGSTNGTAGAPTGTGHSIKAYPNGWYRVTISMNHVASPSYPVIVLGDSASLFGGNNQPFYSATTPYKSLIVWGAQLEAGVAASSYIPTGSSTVQRANDSCVMSGTNFSSWFNATQGTMLTTWSGTGVTSGRYATINDGSASNQIWTGFSESAIYNGSFQASFGPAGTANGKVALAYLLNDAAWCLNGGAVSTDTAVTLPTGLNQISIGNSQAGTAAIGTALRTVKYFPLRLTNAQIQAITA